LVGLLCFPTHAVVIWMIALGAAAGAGFALSMIMFVHRARGTDSSAALSGMAQTIGYLVAAAGPLSAGALHDATGGWTVPLVVLVALAVPLLYCGWIACGDRTVEDR
jgi:MFS transporter, CP family, cyanate transporter